MKSILFCFMLSLALSGCVAMGVPATSDPQQMLVYASDLVREDRTEAAKGLIDSAIAKYTETENAAGLAEAYFALANLYKSPKFESAIDGRKFTDHDKALAYYTLAEDQYRVVNNYEGVIKSRWAMGNIQTMKGDFARACEEYLRTGDIYQEMLQKNPEQEPRLTVTAGYGYDSFPTMLQAFRTKYHCR